MAKLWVILEDFLNNVLAEVSFDLIDRGFSDNVCKGVFSIFFRGEEVTDWRIIGRPLKPTVVASLVGEIRRALNWRDCLVVLLREVLKLLAGGLYIYELVVV